MRSRLAFAALALAAAGTATADPAWTGHALLDGGKGYVQAPLGEMHYRDVGPRGSKVVVVLLHQSPLYMIELAPVQNALAAKGFRTITFDTPGYGMSDHPQGMPSIEALADNVSAALKQMGLKRVVIGGHHTGAEIAVAFAARHPDQARGVVLNGIPVFTKTESAQWLARCCAEPPPLKPDGSHMGIVFSHRPPGTVPDQADVVGRTWMTLGTFFQSRDIGHRAALAYLSEPDLRAIREPGLIITNGKDQMHEHDLRAKRIRPDFAMVQLGPTMFDLMVAPQPFADAVAAWLKTLD